MTRSTLIAAAVVVAVAGVVVGGGCPRDNNDTNMMPKLPPPPAPKLDDDLHIDVTIDGKPAAPIDKAMLRAHAPDFRDEDHSAWKIAPLLGVDARAQITAVGEKQFELTLPAPAALTDLQPVLWLSRRGDVSAAAVSPAEPFPAFHHQGHQLQRAGDPLPRLQGKLVALHIVTAH